MAFDSAGDLFVLASGSGNIYEFTNGIATEQGTFASGVNYANALVFNSAGNLFVSDYYHGNIYEFTPAGVQSTFASGLNDPTGLAIDSAGNLFESDFGSGNIYEFTPGGVQSTFTSGLNGPTGLAIDGAGDLFESDFGSGNIYEFTNGIAAEQGTFASGLDGPQGLAFAPNQSVTVPQLSISCYGNNVILTWPAKATVFTLQTTPTLGSSAAWSTVFPAPVLVNGQNTVTIPISGTQQFYQLTSN
jgi:hypothetical protein